MNRIVLVSYPTKEFPNNTPSAFKVRLPLPLELKGEGWKVGPASVSTSDAGLDLSRLADDLKNYVLMVSVNLVTSLTDVNSWHRQLSPVTVEDITQDPSIVDGVSLMKALIFITQKYDFMKVQTQTKRLYQKYRIQYKWEGEELVILALNYNDIVLVSSSTDYAWVEWKVHINMALKMKWLVKKKDKSYMIGPYLRHEPVYKSSSDGSYYKPAENTELGSHDLWKIEDSHLRLSLCVNWRFINLNVAFREVVGEPARTFMVYSDVVDSNIIGGQMHAVMREDEYRR